MRRAPEAERRARMASGIARVGIAIGLLYFLRIALVLPDPLRVPLGLLTLGLSAVCAGSLAGVRAGIDPTRLMHGAVAYAGVMCATLAYYLGGFQGPVLHWLLVLPAVPLFACSLRAGLVCFAGCQLVYLGFAWRTLFGPAGPEPPRPELISQLWLGSISGQAITLLALMVVFERTKDEALALLRRANGALIRARDAADRASASKSQFLARVSHEIRAPMTVILDFADGLGERLGALYRWRPSLEKIQRNARHLLDLIDDLLDLSRIEAGRLDLELASCRPVEVATDAVAEVWTRARAGCAKPRVRCANGAPREIRTDPKALRQILAKLVSNAIKFGEGRAVRLSVEAIALADGARGVRFAVRDRGIGIAAGDMERLFDPFQRADTSTARKYGGTGLGLAISRQLCRRMGGRLHAESTPGAGSTFHVDLPLDCDEAAPVQRTDAADTAASIGSPRPPTSARPSGAPHHEVADDVVGERPPHVAAGFDARDAGAHTGRPREGPWDRLVRRFVPPGLESDPAEMHRAWVVVGVATATAPLALLWGVILPHILESPGGDVFGAMVALTAPMLLAIPVLLRRSGSIALACNCLAAYGFVLLAALSYCTGGPGAPSSFWLLLLPLATPVLGVRSGVVWTGLALGFFATVFSLERLGHTSPDWLLPEAAGWVAVLSAMTSSALVFTLLRMYARKQQMSISELADANAALRVARENAERASRGKSEFLAHMSHEIRTPMTAILGFAEILVDEWHETGADADLLTKVGAVHESGRNLLALVDELLDLSRIEVGRLELERIAFAPASLCREVVELLAERAQAKGLELALEIAHGVPDRVEADPARVRQVLVNLIGSGLESAASGAVVLRLSAPHERLRFELTDTATEPPTFEPFGAPVVADGAAETNPNGLGLAISRLVCELMGGRIEVTDAPGLGIRFCFEIPAIPAAPPAHRRPTARDRAGPVPSPLQANVLLAEDGPDNQALISHILRRAGAAVAIASNGREAVEAVERAHDAEPPFDLVLMDMQMPVLDGYGAVIEIRRRGHTLPIVALTAHALKDEEVRCLEAGCDGFATKPIDRRHLIDLVRRFAATAKPPPET